MGGKVYMDFILYTEKLTDTTVPLSSEISETLITTEVQSPIQTVTNVATTEVSDFRDNPVTSEVLLTL